MRKLGQDPAPLLALISGIMGALAFPPFRVWPLVFVAPIPLLWGLDQRGQGNLRRAFMLGWAAGFAFFLILLDWILALPGEEVTIPGLMTPALLLLSAYLGAYSGVAALLTVWVRRRIPAAPLGIIWALLALVADAARSHGELGFPWGSPGYALAGATPLLQFTSLTGFWGLVLLVNLIGAILFHGLRTTGARNRSAAMGIALALILVPWMYGAARLAKAPRDRVDGSTGIHVAVIQPNTSRTIKWDPRYRELVVDDLLRRTVAAARTRPDLIIWPETAAPMILLQEPVLLGRVEETIRSIGVPVLVGTLDHRLLGGAYVAHNSAALIGGDGAIIDRYDKQRLVPFSEYMPFPKALPFLSGLNFGQSDFTPGEVSTIFRVGDAGFGCLICFESIFPEVARRFVAKGAHFLVNITNDFWFGETAAAAQHADMAIFRAVENGVPLVRCANTGISMIVDPWGRVTHRTAIFVEATIDTRVTPSSATTFYTRHGEWLLRWVMGIAGAWIVCAAIASRNPR